MSGNRHPPTSNPSRYPPPPPPPPPSTFPPFPQQPPFPQLLHIKDESPYPPHRTTMSSPDRGARAGEDELSDDGEGDSPNVSGYGAGGSGEVRGKEGKIGGSRPVATRRRVVQSCSECRRRKIKCDKKFPCGPCVLRNDQARCHEVGMAEKHVVSNTSNYATTSDLALLAHRLDALESSLIKSGALLPQDLDHYLKSTREAIVSLSSTNAIAPRHELESQTRFHPDSQRPPPEQAPMGEEENLDDTEGAALTLEHLAFGRSRVDGSHSLPHFGARQPSTVQRSAPNGNYHLARMSITGISPTSTPHDSAKQLLSHPSDGVVPAAGPERSLAARRESGLVGNVLPSQTRGKGYIENLTAEERGARIDALLDLLGPTDVFDLFYRKTDVALRAMTKCLPSKEKGEILVHAYLEKVDWLHRCLHVPTFLRQCADLWALPKEMIVHEISMPFVGLYFSVLTLGIQFMDAADAAKHFTAEETRTLPDLWYNASRSALWAGDFIGSHSMENLQCLILLAVHMNNRDRADAAWALLGASVKMAQGLGLSRLGAEQQAVDGKPSPMWTGRWESLIQREIGRRIWWNLVFLDWALAPSYNFNCSIQPDQIKTALPGNIDDEDIVDGQPFRPQPLHVRTSMSFQLARLKFAEISHRQIWQANNHNHPPYSFILSVDGELRKAMMELPAFFQPDPSTRGPPSQEPKALVQYYEKILLNLAIHSRMLRLHRPWLSRGYEDERYAYSKEQCIRAARASLRMMSGSDGTAAFLEKWWIPLFHVSVSGLVVIIDLLRTAKRDMHSTETGQKIAEVKGALDQMRRIADVSHPSRAAVKVMDFLLAEVEDRRKPPGSALGKRKASDATSPTPDDDESSLQRAVKKLIRQAQLESNSPSQSTGSGATPGATVPSPRTGVDMRIFSDTPRDRPVFDAYPMPSSTHDPLNQTSTQAASSSDNHDSLAVPNVQQLSQPISPFTYPVDPTQPSNFPAFVPQPQPTPHLDPAVESMLASYFPTPAQQPGGMQMPMGPGSQVPEDFLSRVFGFGWDQGQGQGNQGQGMSGTTGGGAGAAAGGGGGGGPGGMGAMKGAGGGGWAVGSGDKAGNGEGRPGAGGAAGETGGDWMGGTAPIPGYEQWSSHGWMA